MSKETRHQVLPREPNVLGSVWSFPLSHAALFILREHQCPCVPIPRSEYTLLSACFQRSFYAYSIGLLSDMLSAKEEKHTFASLRQAATDSNKGIWYGRGKSAQASCAAASRVGQRPALAPLRRTLAAERGTPKGKDRPGGEGRPTRGAQGQGGRAGRCIAGGAAAQLACVGPFRGFLHSPPFHLREFSVRC
jgi:hypothetical protein